MANEVHISAGLPIARDGTADSSNVAHMSAGLAAEITSGTPTGWSHNIYGIEPTKVYGVAPTKVLGV